MKVIGKGILVEFYQRHGDVKSQIEAWIKEAENAVWRTSMDIKQRYASASFLRDNRVVFNLKGGNYRLDTKVAYNTQVVFIKRIGTHKEYSKWKFD